MKTRKFALKDLVGNKAGYVGHVTAMYPEDGEVMCVVAEIGNPVKTRTFNQNALSQKMAA